MGRLRSIIERHQGLIVATVAVAIGLGLATWARWPRPRLTWTQPSVSSGSENLAVSPDGRRFLMIGQGKVWVRDLESGRTVQLDLIEPGDPKEEFPGVVRFLGDGRTVMASWQPTGLVRVWDVDSGRKLFERPASPWGVWSFETFAADGSVVAILTMGRERDKPPPTIVAWSRRWDRPRSHRFSQPMALSANGKYLASGDEVYPQQSLVVREAETGRQVGSIPTALLADFQSIAVSDDGRTLVVLGPSGTTVWDVSTAANRGRFAPPNFRNNAEYDTSPVLTEGGRSLILERPEVPGFGLEAWDLTAQPPRRTYLGPVLARSPDRRRVVRRDATSDRIELVALPDGKAIPANIDPRAEFLEFSPDGRVLGLSINQSTTSASHPILSRLPPRFRPRWFDQEATEVRVLDATTGRQLASITMPEVDRGLDFALTPDAKSVIVRTFEPRDDTLVIARFDLWDIQPRPTVWPIEAVLSGLAVGLGIWWDLVRGLRSNGIRLAEGDISP